MAEVVHMPKLSDTMTEGVVAEWHKKVGEEVTSGDLLAEIESDKATMEFESFYDGTLLHIGVQKGETAEVDALLCVIGEKGEDISALLSGGQLNEASSESVKEENNSSQKESTSQPVTIEGVEVVQMPKLSDTMEEGVVAEWHKNVGDEVSSGEILAEIESDKATMEFESFYDGTLLHIGVNKGENAPVDSLLCIIGPKGTNVDTIINNFSTVSPSIEQPKEVIKEAPKSEVKSQPASVNSTSATVNTQKSVKATIVNNGRIFASPLAKKMASDKGIDLKFVAGSGENGRIVKRDIENYVPVVSENTTSSSIVATENSYEKTNSQMRKTIAKRLAESKFSAPHYYLKVEIDMDNAIASRKAINNIPDTKVSFNDMVVKACAMALKKHPQVNTSWEDNVTVYHDHVSIGVAVAVEDGLLVPVVRFTDTKNLSQISAEVKDLATRARDKKLQPQDWEGSTFAISNLGMFGIDEFTSIINQPNSAILSVGKISQVPVVKNGEIVPGNVMKVTLACDHRTVDGATGAQFLATFKQYLENPVTMLA